LELATKLSFNPLVVTAIGPLRAGPALRSLLPIASTKERTMTQHHYPYGVFFHLTAWSIARIPIMAAVIGWGVVAAEDRLFDGRNNNVQNPKWGAAGTTYNRVAAPAYGDGISKLAGTDRPGPRELSNAVGRQETSVPNARGLSGYVYAFGQFLNHDLEWTRSSGESIAIPTPSSDPLFHGSPLPLRGSRFDINTGKGVDNPRQQTNFVTSYIDASNVYGSDRDRADKLRDKTGNVLSAKLRTSGAAQNVLPRNTAVSVEMDNAGFQQAVNLFAAGDARANENAGLASLHTLFMREHNRLVDELSVANPTWSHEELYQRARKIVGAQMQVITYQEFLPALLGPHSPADHAVYDSSIDASVINEFAVVFLRVGHSMLPTHFRRIRNDGTVGPRDPVSIFDTGFDAVNWVGRSAVLDLHLKGLSFEQQEEVDALYTDDIRNQPIGDLFSIDLRRARHHGLADYNTMRTAYGLPAVTTFREITSNGALAAALEQLYGDVNRIDPLIGTLAEDHLPGASVGALAVAGLTAQFIRLRDGDRFWYENDPAFSPDEVAALGNTRLSDIIPRNTSITNLQDNVFFVPEPGDFDGNGLLDLSDIDRLTSQIRPGENMVLLDVNQDGLVNSVDRRVWVQELKGTYFGDANLDGEFSSTDLIAVFQQAQYEDNVSANSTWSRGDWNGDSEFDSGDLVLAFQDGGFEAGPRASSLAVPEPGSHLFAAAIVAALGVGRVRRRRL
jgi:hypothetical protein